MKKFREGGGPGPLGAVAPIKQTNAKLQDFHWLINDGRPCIIPKEQLNFYATLPG